MSVTVPDAAFTALLEFLRRVRGFDFTGYKPASLMRRIDKRMQQVGVADYAAYVEYLELHADEFEQLFNTVLINVTAFFRDPDAWEALRAEVLPRLAKVREDGAPIRVWSASCATGEEAYTLAMVLAEEFGEQAVRERVKIYATDVDEEALAIARTATYSARALEDVPAPLREKYFEPSGGRFAFRSDLRRAVIFGRHDLIQDAPISRVDLLVCRNALMYFNAETQDRILVRFHFALNDGAALFLGRAETLLAHSNIFEALDLKQRIFTKIPRVLFRERMFTLPVRSAVAPVAAPVDGAMRLRDAAFDTSPVAQLVIDAAGALHAANERARVLFELTARDVGRPLQDLEVSYRPVELRSCIERAYADGRPVAVRDVDWAPVGADRLRFDVRVSPISDGSAAPLGVSVSFTDVTDAARLQRELQLTNQELESAYAELQSTNEELETTNEELQSTVEELETMNEELHSTNEELQTINDEVRRRSEEVGNLNAFLGSVLTSVRAAVVAVDRDTQVLVWSRHAEEMWGLRAGETEGRHLLNLDFGLPAAELRQPIRQCLAGEREVIEVTLAAMNRRGRAFDCQVVCTPLVGVDDDVRGVLLLMR